MEISKRKKEKDPKPIEAQMENETPQSAESIRKKDLRRMTLLILLYLLQGIPLGLTLGSIQFILKGKLSFTEMSLFSFVSYPYSLKLFWSPIVDSIYFKDFGRRKTWIVPIQLILSFLLFYIGSNIEDWMNAEHVPIQFLSGIFFILVFLTATQDIAVDGWGISMLSEERKGDVSMCQTIGLNSGYFISFTIFLVFNSPEFCNNYLRSVVGMEENPLGILQLGSFIQFWALAFLLTTLCLIFFVSEDDVVEEQYSVKEVYQQIWQICNLPNMRRLILILLISKLGFIVSESVGPLKLVEKGFKKEDLALTVLLDFPLQLFVSYHLSRFNREREPLKPWLFGFSLRLFLSLCGMLLISSFPEGEMTSSFLFFVVLSSLITSCASTIMFSSLGSFFAMISDKAIGGTYMTLLNTITNFGGTWPQFLIFRSIDFFSISRCEKMEDSGTFENPQANILEPDCLGVESKHLCEKLGGQCLFLQDGFYFVGGFCFLFGLLSFWFYIRREAERLQRIASGQWKVAAR